MSVPARLLSVRLQGFKSFASRTVVEFGSGISAIVGPNGAGKSNLADALRWALGEQGRALRSRRSEDIIFAGSEVKPALGMADVTLVVENADGLLPVEYSVVELGRRLFRSGENEYLLNGTRVRLRDLEDLLDAARLADNAFLFIGQGMVDQALALRPEERRPLFTEVAGVRRHERRKRAAEERLAEAETNLGRIRDILAELRPQARRLAAQAEQQAARAAAADALGRAIVASGRQRWHVAAARLAKAGDVRRQTQAEMDTVIGELRAADDEVAELTAGLDQRQTELVAARDDLEKARATLVDARVAAARLEAEREALARDRRRLEDEREATAQRVGAARRRLALPWPSARSPAQRGPEPPPPAPVRVGQTNVALREEEAAYERAGRAETEARITHEETVAALAAASAAVDRAGRAAEQARQKLAALVGERRAAADRVATKRHAATRLAMALQGLEDRLRDPSEGIPAGGQPLAAGLQVETHLRRAVEAALGVAARGAVVEIEVAGAAVPGSVPLIVRDHPVRSPAPDEGAAAVAAALAAGGGRLVEALRSDPTGTVGRLLERTLWVPELAPALRLAGTLPTGWVVATVRGDALDSRGVLQPAPGSSLLALRADRARIAAELKTAENVAREGEETLRTLDADLSRAEAAAEAATREVIANEAERRAKVEAEAEAAGWHELTVREQAWSRAQLERLGVELARRGGDRGEGAASARGRAEDDGVLAAERSAAQERQRLEGSLAADLARSESIARELERVVAAESLNQADMERQRSLLADLGARVTERETTLRERDAEGAVVRERRQAAERAGRAARERLRLTEGGSRAAEVEELEARMAVDAVREQLLVELAGLGSAGLRVLGTADDGGVFGAHDEVAAGDDAGATALEAALDALTPSWVASAPHDEQPSAAGLATLRRRFHELGAVNPFAAEEHAEVQERLSSLEAQRDDLERAIAATRRLIVDLERLISEQFETTFRALEAAFGRRFTQLFGGGYARLALTDPDDPTISGVEITARPPGKKAQPLSMLSGGERALTAVALLFAMLEVRPVPFCVLDEVDAALDEANIGRFAAALRELAAAIQFVVITHNRGTIEEADALYGVTIGDDAVSRVVSLRLDGRAIGRPADEAAAVVPIVPRS